MGDERALGGGRRLLTLVGNGIGEPRRPLDAGEPDTLGCVLAVLGRWGSLCVCEGGWGGVSKPAATYNKGGPAEFRS